MQSAPGRDSCCIPIGPDSCTFHIAYIELSRMKRHGFILFSDSKEYRYDLIIYTNRSQHTKINLKMNILLRESRLCTPTVTYKVP
jgi:hypothetical protein